MGCILDTFSNLFGGNKAVSLSASAALRQQRVMAIEMRTLRTSSLKALDPVNDWLAEALFRAFGDYEVCSENKVLAEKAAEFLKEFARDFQQSSSSEHRITAMRFNGLAILPVQEGSTVALIPVRKISGNPSVGEGASKQNLEVGSYALLKSDTPVEPSFIALLLLSPVPA